MREAPTGGGFGIAACRAVRWTEMRPDKNNPIILEEA
jgi:hypothetical protein